MKMKRDCVAIVGLGLIGGSLAKALKIRGYARELIGVDPDPEQLDPAIQSGIIDRGFRKPGNFLSRCSMVVICAPVPLCAKLVIEVSEHINEDCIITDTASTKKDIMKTVNESGRNIRFIGGHPMAGSERSGFAYSREDMFENAYYLIMGDENDREAVAEVRSMAEAIGSIPLITDPETHDGAVAVISHIPHVTAAALVNLLDLSESAGLGRQIAAGGFRDITRIASSKPSLWKDITINNSEAIAEGIERLVSILNEARNSIIQADEKSTEVFFSNARDTRDLISGEREGLLPRKYQIVIQVADRPGVIARISALLGENDLNIKNINVTHSREDVGGVLVVELYSIEDRNAAMDLLRADGFETSSID